MILIDIPNSPSLRLNHVVLDFNGTLACDGVLINGVRYRLNHLAECLQIHVVTGDIFGRARAEMADVACELIILESQNQQIAKRDYVNHLGAEHSVCIGNGRNDKLMLEVAALGIAVVQSEGAAPETLFAADVVVRNISDALDLLTNPQRVAATLRP
ncbi:HAD family hydrolase [Variovorax sp. Sphag1AA]|uniref:HAD family hydrolase n=1 Tax=Variovorax sp. Sphag1AA TaxID=2587027 RepID=UPI00161AF139|nr:ATPase P [Variovorax sp. Sphag1AA]MBB3181212.1 soluble P-type ATPase [Variovorax sp. Sphag1AA]